MLANKSCRVCGMVSLPLRWAADLLGTCRAEYAEAVESRSGIPICQSRNLGFVKANTFESERVIH